MPSFTDYMVSGGKEFEPGSSPYYVGPQGRLDPKRDSDLSSARANLEQKLFASGTWRKLRIRLARPPGTGSAVVRLKDQNGTVATATIAPSPGGVAFTYEADVNQSLSTGDTLVWEIDTSNTSGAKLAIEWIALE
ncbi:MAG: hypothetical protein IT449_09465 [Phycisphaerales bacterium]|nr:hypothetical protein [Phycisphaerales bacterium]